VFLAYIKRCCTDPRKSVTMFPVSWPQNNIKCTITQWDSIPLSLENPDVTFTMLIFRLLS